MTPPPSPEKRNRFQALTKFKLYFNAATRLKKNSFAKTVDQI